MKANAEQLNRIVTEDEKRPVVNIGCGQDVTVREIAELIADVVGFRGGSSLILRNLMEHLASFSIRAS
jgi:nucleoside-diphosphate-sugar epimerase